MSFILDAKSTGSFKLHLGEIKVTVSLYLVSSFNNLRVTVRQNK